MMQVKEPEIKLFGKKIAFPENGRRVVVTFSGEDYSSDSGGAGAVYCGENSSGSDSDRSKICRVEETEGGDGKKMQELELADMDCSTGEVSKIRPSVEDQHPIPAEFLNSKASPDSDESSNTSTMDEDSPAKQSLKPENDQSDASNTPLKTLKKPDKILPCPRCNSMDTKFCYYNNYNINQPRHFCKSCQRYWTAGGTMRNVPVGAGRRKNKNSSSHCRHITISEALQAARIDNPNGFHHLNFKHNGTVLSFGSGSGSTICDSMGSLQLLSEKNPPNVSQNGFHKHDPMTISLVSCKRTENSDDCSSGSSVTTSKSVVQGAKNGLQEPVMQQINGFPSPVPCIPGVPWSFPWNSAVPLPAIYPSGFPMPFYPAPFWNCGVPGAWNIPWVPPVSPSGIQKNSGSCTNSPTLGKHSRDGELIKPDYPEESESPQDKNSENSVLVPKILRIDDPDEAAKSSIWTTLGINYDSNRREGLFKALQPKCKGDEKKHSDATSPVLQANPAALSRSINFQETA